MNCNMNLYPKQYLNNVTEFTLEKIEENGIKGIILDVDNTLIDYYKNMLDGVEKWCKELQNAGIKFCIASNSNNEEKVATVANKLNIPYVFFARKPLKVGLNKAKTIIGLEEDKIAVIGDQIFTDVLGANRCKMYSVLVEPIEEKDIFITVIKRPIENWVKKRYKKHLSNNKK